MNRRRFLAKAVAMTGATSFFTAGIDALADRVEHGYEAMVCEGCAVHKKHLRCICCGELNCGDLDCYEIALVCFMCNDDGKNCAICGNMIGESTTKARVCHRCSDKLRLKCYKCKRDMF